MLKGTADWPALTRTFLTAFIIGGFIFSPTLLGKVWMKENDLIRIKIKKAIKSKIFGWSFVLILILAVNLFIPPQRPLDLYLGLVCALLTVWMCAPSTELLK
jgi:hypothetical protein